MCIKAAVTVLAVLIGTVACSFSKERREAEALAEQYFSTMQGGNVANVLAFYSPRFYSVTSRADWLAFLNDLHARCGTPKTHSLITWNVFSSLGTHAGTRTTLVYDVQYSTCRLSEKMTVFKPDGGQIRIDGHLLTPKAPVPDDKGSVQAAARST
jgi:hypothetical protein